ncbi:MAG: aspartate/glutamate racemase family protein [Bacillota bacterium]
MTLLKSPNTNQVSFGEAIGIILLKTVTPTIPGDVACALSYDYPVRYKVIEEATISEMFSDPTRLLKQFKQAGRELEDAGVKAVTGDCGFMAVLQDEMAKSLNVPAFMSSLLQIPLLDTMLGRQKKIGIITANSDALGKKHFTGVGISPETQERLVVGGMEKKPHFNEVIIGEKPELDPVLMEEEMVDLAEEMVAEEGVEAFLVECSVLPPYSAAIQSATNLPVFDFLTLINYVYSGVVQTNNVFYKS